MIVCRLVALHYILNKYQSRKGGHWTGGVNLVQTLRIVQIFMYDMSQEI